MSEMDNTISLTQDTPETSTSRVGNISEASTLPSEKAPENLQCRSCCYRFTDRADQVLHYKLDWHLYNVKQRLRGLPTLGEQEFDTRCDRDGDLSSLSGSDSEEDDYNVVTDTVTSLFLDDSPDLSNAVICSPYLLFKHKDMFYKCPYALLFSNQIELTDDLLSETLTQSTAMSSDNTLHHNGRVAVFLYSAQHFAGVVYENNQLLLHKTYHRYTVRAKQGTVQGIRDGKGNAPKSYGASLRRYNQIALFADIEKLLLSWADTLNGCSVIFHRTATHNRHVFEKLKEKLDNKKHKIRTIPFTTYRPTLKEAERVYKLLTKINKVFEKEFQNAVDANNTRENVEPDPITKPSQQPKVNPKSIPNSHIKQRPVKPVKLQPEQPIPELKFYNNPENVYHKLMTSLQKRDQTSFSDLLSSEHIDLETPLEQNNTLLHLAACAPDPCWVAQLLQCGANPELRNSNGKTPYETAEKKEVRDEFRRFMARFPEKWNYKQAKIPSPLTPAMEEEQARKKAEKKRAQRAAKNQRDKEKRAAKKEAEKKEEEKLVAEAQKLRMRQLTPRERCLLAAEARLAAQGGRGSTSGKCANCETGLDGLVPFERLQFKYCSVVCVREHKDKL